MGGWDPVVIETTWSIYDCLDAVKALTIKAGFLASLSGGVESKLSGMTQKFGGIRRRR